MNQKFRERTPVRRTNSKLVNDYREFKTDLKEDFNCRCGYCNDHDYFRTADYQIDHFVPRTKLKSIKPTDYSNLVYACRSCNRAKWNKWPSGDEKIANDGKEGFIDPCNTEYDKQFSRNARGEIIPNTPLGVWMWKALNFGNPVHCVVWKLEQILKNIIELQKIADSKPNNVSVLTALNTLNKNFHSYFDQLMGGSPKF